METTNNRNLINRTKTGSELAVGDTVEVWWAPQRDTVVALKPYEGNLAKEYPGLKIAEFALYKVGMTVFPDDGFTVIGIKA